MACIHDHIERLHVEKFSLLKKKLDFGISGIQYYYINNYTKDILKTDSFEYINKAFSDWNAELEKYNFSFKRTEIKADAYVQIYFVGGDSGLMPDEPYHVIMDDADMIAFLQPNTGNIWINDNIDWSKDISLTYSLGHEIGHLLGMAHTKDNPKDLMNPSYEEGNKITKDSRDALAELFGIKIPPIPYELIILAVVASAMAIFLAYKLIS